MHLLIEFGIFFVKKASNSNRDFPLLFLLSILGC